MMTMKLFLVCESAFFPVEGEAPAGEYGVDWCVVEAPNGRTAVRAAELAEGYVREARVLPEDAARWAFEEASAVWPPEGTVVVDGLVVPAVRRAS